MLYKRGNVWWYEFAFDGVRIRESSGTDSKTIARQAELKRRRDLELSISGIRRERPLVLSEAAKQWLATKTALSPLGLRYYRQLPSQTRAPLRQAIRNRFDPRRCSAPSKAATGRGALGSANQRRDRHAESGSTVSRALVSNFWPNPHAATKCRSGTGAEFRGDRAAS